MSVHRRTAPSSDSMTVGLLLTAATRTWEPPTGVHRDARLARLREISGGNADLLAEAAGVLLGVRPDDPHDPRHEQNTIGAALLLEVAGVEEDDERVQRAIAVGRERRERGRVRPEPDRSWRTAEPPAPR